MAMATRSRSAIREVATTDNNVTSVLLHVI